MARKQGQQPKQLGQRSISSMFSNSRTTAGRSDTNRPLPLMEFLTRKLEKRSSLQGGHVNAGLTLEVKEILDAMRNSDTRRSNKLLEKNEGNHGSEGKMCMREVAPPFQRNSEALWAQDFRSFGTPTSNAKFANNEDNAISRDNEGTIHCLDEDSSTSGCQGDVPTNKHHTRTRQNLESIDSQSGGNVGDKGVASHFLDRRRSADLQLPTRLIIPSVRYGSSLPNEVHCYSSRLSQEIHKLGLRESMNTAHHLRSHHIDIYDLTEDEDTAVGRTEVEQVVRAEEADICRKRKRLQTLSSDKATERCPVCNKLFPIDMLQAHVESELDGLELLDSDSVAEAQGLPTYDNRQLDESSGAWQGHDHTSQDKSPGCSVHRREPNFQSRPRQSVLVLGDEPQYRKQPRLRPKNERRTAHFNHYADGGGWWDEGAVGVDAEAVGSASTWEGLGSMSFGSTKFGSTL